MERARYLELLETDGEALAVAAPRDLRAAVPSCPDWNVADLVRHVGRIHRHKAGIVRAASPAYQPGYETSRTVVAPLDDELIDWYRAGLRGLVESLSSRDPESPAWSWAGDHRVAFWNRRMAQETAVHRWDVENALGEPSPIDPELASDGVDEALGTFVRLSKVPYQDRPGFVRLKCTDVRGDWVVTLKPGEIPIHEAAPDVPIHDAAADGEADAVVRHVASDVLLFVWRRLTPGQVEVSGDHELVESFWRYLAELTR
jgi:uncharacterized protein (TIGR03083 family)